jgi:hypothetical protein
MRRRTVSARRIATSVLYTVRVSIRSVLKGNTKEVVLFEKDGGPERSAMYTSQTVASLKWLPDLLRHYGPTGTTIIQDLHSSAIIDGSVAVIQVRGALRSANVHAQEEAKISLGDLAGECVCNDAVH